MPDQTVRVGDVVAWDDVPVNAMVRCLLRHLYPWYALHFGADRGVWVHDPYVNEWWSRSANRTWDWIGQPASLRGMPAIIALNLTGNETADELREMAERFDADAGREDAAAINEMAAYPSEPVDDAT